MNGKKTILIADDEFNTRTALERFFKRKYAISTAADGSAALDLLREQSFDLVLTDLRMPGADGMSVLKAAAQKGIPCVLLTAYGSITDAVQAVKLGAYDFVSKPVKLAQLETVIETALSQETAVPSSQPVPEKNTGKIDGIVTPDGISSPMAAVYDTARTVAPSRASVLLTGESGTGKEVIARLIHENSGRTGAFVPVHCAALTSTILESELFGYEKGAFTGANETRAGKFELADKGTVFLDEIGEIDAATQVKLLRVLETRAFERVGGTQTVHSDFRLISATNRDLKQMVRDGSFREDLFFRLSVINLKLPPLRERRNEIPALVQKFAAEFASENGMPSPGIDPGTMQKLCNAPWHGNIRELRNCIESMVVLSGGKILSDSLLPPEFSTGETEEIPPVSASEISSLPLDSPKLDIHDAEIKLIEQALEKCNGNRTQAATMLGISRRTLQRKLSAFFPSEKKLGKKS
ncbi:MAG: sigma-54-dependent Fis family transcriptional regulator [Lentisphaeria bacterium]|nr:sigma-54-dependent Fis family transcriptional regulator [Lentisphaeria bacterium]